MLKNYLFKVQQKFIIKQQWCKVKNIYQNPQNGKCYSYRHPGKHLQTDVNDLIFVSWYFSLLFNLFQSLRHPLVLLSDNIVEIMNFLLIDNYDSFTFNLVQALAKMGAAIQVFRNDEIDLHEIAEMRPDRIVISPGPKGPQDAGISKKVIETFSPTIPVLGVCLGMQCINEVFGGETIKASVCVHGKTSSIFHNQQGLYMGLENPFSGARYHSLIADKVPACFQVEAWTEDNITMGIRHQEYPLVGVQFHPESFLTESGEIILRHFLLGRF